MSTRRMALGALGYTLATFALAVVWHIVLFEAKYRSFGYIEDEPSFGLGLAAIAIQGIVLSFLFPRVKFPGSRVSRGLTFAALLGAFFWTSHVLAFLAKQTVPGALQFTLMESAYLALQFGIYGLLLDFIHRRDPAPHEPIPA